MTTAAASLYAAPNVTPRFWPVVLRNLLVWKKLAVPSIVGNIAEPLITLVAFGYGLGTLVGQIDGRPYVQFLASGSVTARTIASLTIISNLPSRGTTLRDSRSLGRISRLRPG